MGGWLTDWEKAQEAREDAPQSHPRKHGVYAEGNGWCAYVNGALVASGPDRRIISSAWTHHAHDADLPTTAPPEQVVEADGVVIEFVQTMASKVGKFRQALKDQQIHVGIGTPPICATCDTPWPCAEGAAR